MEGLFSKRKIDSDRKSKDCFQENDPFPSKLNDCFPRERLVPSKIEQLFSKKMIRFDRRWNDCFQDKD